MNRLDCEQLARLIRIVHRRLLLLLGLKEPLRQILAQLVCPLTDKGCLTELVVLAE